MYVYHEPKVKVFPFITATQLCSSIRDTHFYPAVVSSFGSFGAGLQELVDKIAEVAEHEERSSRSVAKRQLRASIGFALQCVLGRLLRHDGVHVTSWYGKQDASNGRRGQDREGRGLGWWRNIVNLRQPKRRYRGGGGRQRVTLGYR